MNEGGHQLTHKLSEIQHNEQKFFDTPHFSFSQSKMKRKKERNHLNMDDIPLAAELDNSLRWPFLGLSLLVSCKGKSKLRIKKIHFLVCKIKRENAETNKHVYLISVRIQITKQKRTRQGAL